MQRYNLTFLALAASGNTMQFGIIQERKSPPDERVPLSPRYARELSEMDDKVKVYVESSPIRRIGDDEYRSAGLEVTENLNGCDILMGVKEVPIEALIPERTYFFFSHTIKKQPYNKKLMHALLEKRITMIDYECLTDPQGRRLIGFGRYAGVVGTYNTIRMIGLVENTYSLKKAHDCNDRQEMESELAKASLPNYKIVLTGGGRVARGAIEILERANIKRVDSHSFKTTEYDHAVYTQIDVLDYNRRKDGSEGKVAEFFVNPDLYEGAFGEFAQAADVFISGHYWDPRSPHFITKEDLLDPSFRLKFVGDISCDIGEPIATTIRPSTIENPIYYIQKETCTEVNQPNENTVSVMAVDNLPCELPRDASADFGADLMEKILPSFFNGDEDGILERATICKDGHLMPRFSYLQDWVNSESE